MDREAFDCFCDAASRRTDKAVLLVCAHPDDETVGAGARLGWLDVLHLAYTTDGALAARRRDGFRKRAQVELAALRRKEMDAALSCGGAVVSTCTWIGFGDQETSHHLTLLTRRIHALITTVRPDIIVTHAYEGGHPDHDATAFAVAYARKVMQHAGQTTPLHLEFTSYHAHKGEIRTGRFLEESGDERVLALGAPERDRKTRMLECYTSQREMLRWFSVERECFRPAPDYNFTVPPHPGRLFYENFNWGVTGAHWRELAAEALDQLQREVVRC